VFVARNENFVLYGQETQNLRFEPFVEHCAMAGKRGSLRFSQRDVTRAFCAAKTAGLDVRIDIARDGTLTILPLCSRQPRHKPMNGTKPLVSFRLKYVHAFKDRHGKPRHYFRRPGQKRVPLPGLPGSAEFIAAYQAPEAARS
jgi:hypothetical protein